MAEALRLYGLKAMVTGAAEGIGEAIVLTFVKHGAEVLAVDAPDSHVDSIFARTKGVIPLVADGDAAEVSAPTVRKRLGGLDILVNNFAAWVDAAAGDGEAALASQHERMLECMSATSQRMLPLLEKSPAGRIINMGCLRSSFGPEGLEQYAASQRAIAKLTADLATEVGRSGITANYIQPGAIMTPASRATFDADKSFRDRCIAASAARRLGEPVDVAKVALFLATDDAVFVSGTGIVVDGGAAPGAAAR